MNSQQSDLPQQPDAARPPVESDAARELALRILYMLLFAVVFWVVCWALAITAIGQLALRVLTGKPSADLARFGTGLARFAGQIVEFLTFASERVPFPFGSWPDAAAPDTVR